MSNRFIPDRDVPTSSDAPIPAGEREFTASENIVVEGLSTWMGVVGVFMIVIGMLQALLGMLTLKTIGDGLTIAEGVLMALVGGLLWGASRSFKDIVKTRGSDVLHLMQALQKLRSAYTIQGVALITISALIVIAIILRAG